MSVYAFATKFEHLARFYTQATSEAWRCKKFVKGLKHELKKTIAPMGIKEFTAIVENVKLVDILEKGDSRVIRTREGGSPVRRPMHIDINLMLDLNTMR